MASNRMVFCTFVFALIHGLVFSLDYPKYETRSRVVVQNGRYVDLLVAIGTSVEEDEDLIDSIKAVIDEFSRKLHDVTGLSFGNVHILVPAFWAPNDQLYSSIAWENFDNSDIRIDNVGATQAERLAGFRDAPFTVKASQCGSPGQYIVLTPGFTQDPRLADDFGGYGKALLREWAKYRWGVFDESPTDDDPHFYASSTGDIEATRCSKERQGDLRTSSGRTCRRSADGFPEADCRFVDTVTNIGSAQVEASLLYRQFISSIGDFCDGAVGNIAARLLHNQEAPNLQNRHCDRLSVWEVLREHADFVSTNQWSPPEYRVVHPSNGKIVLVLDRSSSMSEHERIHILRQAAYNFITRVIPDDYKLGIVTFNQEATATSELLTIDDDSRLRLLGELPRPPLGGFTSIGDGVREGLRVLRGGPNGSPEGGQMIVISDGINTDQPDIARVLTEDRYEISTVTIHTIAVGPAVDNDLEKLATRGRHYQHTDFSTTLFDVFSQFEFDSIARRNAEIYSNATRLGPKSSLQIQVYIDDTVEGNLLFLVGSDSTESLSMEVRRPDTSTVDSFIGPNANFRLFSVQVEDVTPGIWTIIMVNDDTQPRNLSVVVGGRVSSNAVPITVDAQWALAEIIPPEAQAIYVTVMKGYIPVAGALVYAMITNDNTEIRQSLYDDGVGADVRANDGIYSAYFTRVDGRGRYGAKIFVEGSQGTTRILTSRYLGRGSNDHLWGLNNRDTETGPFQRVVDAGSFKCNNNRSCAATSVPSQYGPAKVTDLRVENINLAASQFDLVFTSPGTNLMDGRATQYTIRYARSFEDLHRDFDGSPRVQTPSSAAVYLSPSNTGSSISRPKPARSKEVFTLILSQTGDFSYVFGLTTVDREGNVSPVSNYASVSAKFFEAPLPVPPILEPTDPETTTMSRRTTAPIGSPGENAPIDEMEPGAPFPWYYLLLLLLFVIILLLVILILLWKRRGSKDNLIPPTPRASESSGSPNLYNTPNVGYSSGTDHIYEHSEHPPSYSESLVIAAPTSGYGIPTSNIRHQGRNGSVSGPHQSSPYDDSFVRVAATSGYGIPTSSIQHQPDHGSNASAHHAGSSPYEDVRGVGSVNRDLVRHSSIMSPPYRATDEGREAQASIKHDDWVARDGQTHTRRGVVPDRDPLKEASVKTRGHRASEQKVPL